MGKPLRLTLLAFLAVIAIQTFYPLLQVGLITNDDLKLGNAVLDRGLAGAASMLWAFTRRDGRLDIAQLLSWYLPFAVDSFFYFKAVSLLAIVADLALFALFVRSVLRRHEAFFLALLLALVGLQNSWEHSPLTAFPGLFTFTFAYLLGSFLAFQRFLERGGRRWLFFSAALFVLAACSYEMYLIYAPVFFGLGLLAGRSRRQALAAMAPHLVGIGFHLAAWLTSHSLRLGNYSGVTIARRLDLHGIAHVVWQFSVASLPTYFFFGDKYDFLLESYQKTSGLHGLLAALSAGSVIKAALVGGLYAFLMARAARSPFPAGGRRFMAVPAVAVVYFFAPSFLPSLTDRYQEEVKQQLGMQVSYFSLFAWVFMVVPLLLLASRGSRGFRWLFTSVIGLALVFASLAIDYTNSAVGEWQARGRDRFEMVDAFIASPDYGVIPEGSIIYAPSLWKIIATLDFSGTAIDPQPSLDRKYENFWTFYFNHRGRKRVTVADRLERIPPEMRGFFYLRQAQPTYERGQYLLFAFVERRALDLLVSDRVMVYDRSSWTSRILGGAVAGTGGSPASVQLVGGSTSKTTDRFLFDVGSHFFEMGDLQRCAVATEGRLVDVESVFLAGSTPRERRTVVKSAGWFPDGWIEGEARATLQPEEPARLVVDAYAPDYVFKSIGIKAVTLTLELDKVEIATRSVTQGGRFRVEANVEPVAAGELVLRCAPTHAEPGGISPDDIRTLCVVIDKVVLRKREAGE